MRVLIGSTQKMGTGTNVQKRLVALHHLDAPWKPAEVEQRDGRILRQGNENEEVAIYRYVTEGSFDAYMWQALETKARFIAQVMTGDNAARRPRTSAARNSPTPRSRRLPRAIPAVLTLAEADAELQRLTLLKKNHADEQYLARRTVRDLPETIARLKRRLADLAADIATAHAAADPITIGGRTCARKDALDLLGARLQSLPMAVAEPHRFRLGTYRGLSFSAVMYPHSAPQVCIEGAATRFGDLSRQNCGPLAVMNAVERTVGGYGGEQEKTQRDLDIAQGQLSDCTEARLGGVIAACRVPGGTDPGLRDRLEDPAVGHRAHAGNRGAATGPCAGCAHQGAEGGAYESTLRRSESRTRRSATAEAAVTTRIRQASAGHLQRRSRRQQTRMSPR